MHWKFERSWLSDKPFPSVLFLLMTLKNSNVYPSNLIFIHWFLLLKLRERSPLRMCADLFHILWSSFLLHSLGSDYLGCCMFFALCIASNKWTLVIPFYIISPFIFFIIVNLPLIPKIKLELLSPKFHHKVSTKSNSFGSGAYRTPVTIFQKWYLSFCMNNSISICHLQTNGKSV